MTTISHKTLSGAQLHENKGVASATDNTVATASSGATVWQKLTASHLTGTGNSFGAQLLHIRDERASGTAVQGSSATIWNTKTLQTSKTNEITSATLVANQISLPAGTYYIDGQVPIGDSTTGGTGQLRLRNITDSATLVNGVNARWYVNSCPNNLLIYGRFSLSGTKIIEVQAWTSAVTSFGVVVTSGEVEINGDIKIWKIA